jgi:hypothetical protein
VTQGICEVEGGGDAEGKEQSGARYTGATCTGQPSSIKMSVLVIISFKAITIL